MSACVCGFERILRIGHHFLLNILTGSNVLVNVCLLHPDDTLYIILQAITLDVVVMALYEQVGGGQQHDHHPFECNGLLLMNAII